MRYPAIVAALFLMPAVLTTEATAAGPRQGIQIVNNNYIINDHYNDHYNVGPGVRRGYGPYYGYHGYRDYRHRRHFSTHDEAVARIQATHSPQRQTYHPRSLYNPPPLYYNW